MKKNAIIALLGIAAIAVGAITFLTDRLGDSPVILFIRDTSADDSFGPLVFRGMSKYKSSTQDVGFDLLELRQDEGGEHTSSDEDAVLRSRILNAIATHNVVAIVSANKSGSAAQVIDVASAFDIPVLLTVATKNRPRDGFPGITYRLPAANSLQANAISDWCHDQGPDAKIAVLVDPGIYSNDLRKALESEQGLSRLLTFQLGKTTDVVGYLKYGKEAGVNAWIVIGYKDDARDVLTKKDALEISGPILLTDGAYGNWLKELKNGKHAGKIYISLPHLPQKSTSLQEGNPFEAYGYDAGAILSSALKKARTRTDFARLIPQCANNLSTTQECLMPYDLDAKTGENRSAAFSIIEISDGSIP